MKRPRPYVVPIGHIYKITYPNGKIYVGQDRTDDICYFGSANRLLIAADMREQRYDFTIRREILVELRNTTIQELNRLEREYIIKHRSYDPRIGYNRNRIKGSGGL